MTIACMIDTAAFDDVIAGTVTARVDSVAAGRVDFLIVAGRAEITGTEILAADHADTLTDAMNAALAEFLAA